MNNNLSQAVFVADKEGLLPMHYAAERADKHRNLEVVQFILQKNPKGRVGDEVKLPVSPPASTSSKAAAPAPRIGGGLFSKFFS